MSHRPREVRAGGFKPFTAIKISAHGVSTQVEGGKGPHRPPCGAHGPPPLDIGIGTLRKYYFLLAMKLFIGLWTNTANCLLLKGKYFLFCIFINYGSSLASFSLIVVLFGTFLQQINVKMSI